MPYKHGVTGSSPVVPTTIGPVVQSVRTPACHAGGRRFESVPGRHFVHAEQSACSAQHASVAQSVEQGTENPRVVGSIPTGGTMNAGVAHLVERHLAKVEVASSSLVTRSKQIRNAAAFLILIWYRSQVVRQGSAKPSFPSSNLGGTSKKSAGRFF